MLFSYLSIEKAIMVTIRTCDANSDITVARSQPKSPKGQGYDFHIIVNSNGITKIINLIFSGMQTNILKFIKLIISKKYAN